MTLQEALEASKRKFDDSGKIHWSRGKYRLRRNPVAPDYWGAQRIDLKIRVYYYQDRPNHYEIVDYKSGKVDHAETYAEVQLIALAWGFNPNRGWTPLIPLPFA